jgi:hypothetical protein
MLRYFFRPAAGAAVGWEAGGADPCVAADNAAKPLATSSAALASRTFKYIMG